MYTFQAIANINTVNDHSGFYFVVGVAVFAAIVGMFSLDEVEEVRAWLLVLIVGTCIAAGISYNTGSVTTYANTKVEATLVGFQAEGYNITEQHGKTTTHVDKHESYVVYAVPEGKVMFTASLGQTYPQKAVLYKN